MHIFGYIQHDLLSLLGGLYPMSEAIPNDTKVINAIDAGKENYKRRFLHCVQAINNNPFSLSSQ